MNTATHGLRWLRPVRTSASHPLTARPSFTPRRPSRPGDQPAWVEGLLVGGALLLLAMLQYWQLATH